MKWFNKIKEKRIQRNQELGRKIFGDIWDNKRDRSALTLILWFIFLVFVIGIVRNGNQTKNNNTQENNTPTINYLSLNNYFDNVDNNNYRYNISIYDTATVTFTNFNGEVINGIESGTKENADGVISYNIKNNVIYDANNNQVINNLYGSYLNKFFKLNNIYDFIKDYEPEVRYENDLKVYTYNEEYNDKNIEFIIKVDEKSITYVEYNYDGYKYIVNVTI